MPIYREWLRDFLTAVAIVLGAIWLITR